MKNPYGLINGKLTHINDIQKGDYIICPNCNEELIVREGEKNIKHLAHKIDGNCTGGGEGLIHKLTKQYIFENIKEFEVKKYDMFLECENEEEFVTLGGKKIISIKEKYIEYRGISKDYIPDLYFVLNENLKIALEIYYSNAKDKEELNKKLRYIDDITQVYEIKVTENDLLNLELDKLLKKARLIYNRNKNVFSHCYNRIKKLDEENDKLKQINSSYINEIEELKRMQRLQDELISDYKEKLENNSSYPRLLNTISEQQKKIEELEMVSCYDEVRKRENIIKELNNKLNVHELKIIRKTEIGTTPTIRKVLINSFKNRFFKRIETEIERYKEIDTDMTRILKEIRTHISGNFGHYINTGSLKNLFYLVGFYEKFIKCENKNDYIKLFYNRTEEVEIVESNPKFKLTCNRCGTTSNAQFVFHHDGDEIHDYFDNVEISDDGIYHWFQCKECGNEIVFCFNH